MWNTTVLFPVSWIAVPEKDFGECQVRVIYGDDGHPESLYIDTADPRILISDHLRAQFRDESTRLAVTPGQFVSLTGDVLRIAAANRTVVYRLGEYLSHLCCCVAEWPD